jgi:tetratricopeptide (TPR) repeat protein
MEHEHLDTETLGRVLAQDRTEEQNRCLLHQIAVCPKCHKIGGWLLDLQRAGALGPCFGVVDVALAQSRVEALALWKQCEHLTVENRLARIRDMREVPRWGLAELLCRESREAASKDSSCAIGLAELAVLLAESIEDDEPAEARWAYQLRALSWASLANARRVGSDLPAAEQGFVMADAWWAAGEDTIGDALGYEPVLLDLKASLRIGQRLFEEALSLLDQVVELYLEGDPEHRDPHLAGRALVTKGHALVEMGETTQAIAALRKAERLVDPERSPRLFLCLHHNLIDNLAKAGRYSEADLLLPEVQALSAKHGSDLDRVRLRWVESRIAIGQGERERGRQTLVAVRQVFLDQGIVFDAALASLDLAVLAIEDGRAAEVKALAAEMVAVFQAQRVQREALAAVVMFQKAAEMETATAALAREVAAILHKTRQEASANDGTSPTAQ